MKRFIFYALDQYTLKVYRRKEWEAGVKHGIKCEQQRIIKLLEKRFAENVDNCEWGTHLFLDNAVELIKGEK